MRRRGASPLRFKGEEKPVVLEASDFQNKETNWKLFITKDV